ncbi:MAG: hypothetical protein OXC92_03865 [Flavobacteriaceae bacterium]|nr:hypothetical protein [Flavobacteriaceae bacterium]MCY4216107.1 hypothetical protein [Flavobacteriaceae bacterium]MCY4253577.1 hypothetical protein [Flavobacteriaceae bacterium]
MIPSTFQLIYFFPLFVLGQVLIFSNFNLLYSIDPQVYLLYLLFLPITINQMGLLLIGFFMGICIDLLLDLPAINTIATITILLVRPVIINMFYKKSQNKLIAENRIVKLHRNIGVIISFIVLHQLIYFLLEFSMFKNFVGFLKNFVLTSLISFLFIWTLIGFKIYSNDK